MESDTGTSQDAGSSSQASGADLSGVTRGAWKGSEVTQHEIDWLYRSRRIPEGVSCRIPKDEIEPDLRDGEFVVFLAHLERGFGLPASDFFRQFLDFYKLQPHHLPGNAIFYLSCYATFMEAYMGLRPTRETFARFFSLRINSVQGKEIPKPKPPVQCGSCIIGSRQGSPFFKFAGLDSCRAWERTFFYVKNTGAPDLINLPAFNPAVPTKTNWSYNPKESHIETNRIIRFMKQLMKDTAFCSDDIVRTFISRRVLPLKRRAHKMSEMYGPGDPTKITSFRLTKEDVVLKARHICQSAMPLDWEWGLLPLSSLNPPTEEAKQRFPRIVAEQRGPPQNRALDKEDPDPYVHWADLKMAGLTLHAPVHERVVPLQAEVGHEFLEKLISQEKRKAPAPEAGSSEVPPAKRPKKKPAKRHYVRREMPTSAGFPRALPACLRKVPKMPQGLRLLLNKVRCLLAPATLLPPLWGGTTSVGRAAPTPPDYRAEEDIASPPENQDTGASNTSADTEDAGRAEPQVPPVPKEKKKTSASSPSTSVPETSAPGAPDASAPPKPTTMPPPASSAGGSARPSLQHRRQAKSPLWPKLSRRLRPSPPAPLSPAGSPLCCTPAPPPLWLERGYRPPWPDYELKREGKELGHLLDYAEKWNQADVSAATRGVGKDRLPIIDPAGPRCTEEHFIRLKRAVKEFDNAWHDVTSNAVSTADARKQLFKELLWEHRDLAEAHSHCQAIPEASLEALKTQIVNLQAEKEQLLRDHQTALDAQKTISRELKEQAMQAAVQHSQELKDAKAAAEARLAEVVDDSANSTAVLRAELEEMSKFWKAAEDQVAR
ncbi:hypothetical protein QYE76_051702 [Lolium multiflorum]|uniref:Transposase (putative) gypsy type domain-containing protein n=1 Tax=Lolium multiflorum TaxID=4521 RepID=A0AAD8SU56_LOLMU|nr:hypothetical protein QYE76_051702 [Lolium multiflorum]